MTKPKHGKVPWETRAANVLAGREAVDAGELIDLIHEVNPTGRGRGAGETAARYALKSRLQSLLVTRFADDLEVTPQPDEPGVVALRHRYRRHDACHAVVASLDDDARSWVQRQLDMEATAGPESAPEDAGRPLPAPALPDDEDDLSAAELLAAGEEAQAAYDYERAERCFSRALRASGGGVAAATAFLGFTVDLMAADAEALAIEGILPAATLADPRVALLLAMAAARSGDEPRALRLLGRARDPRAAEVLALLARAALSAGDVDRAARHLHAAEEQDAAHPELRALAEGIARSRAADRAPREAQLAALLAAGRDADALVEAQAILARWPESEPARRASRQIEERQREVEGRRHLGEAEEALARGDALSALQSLQRALACPLPDRERALARTREVEALVRDREARAQADQVASLLVEASRSGAPAGDLARALGAYAELEPGQRPAVRDKVSLPHLAWLDAMPAARRGGRGRAAVEAALALARAASLSEKDLAGAAALIAAHDRILDDVPLARSIEQRARAAAAEERARRAAADLHDAEEAFAAGNLGRARASLEKVDARALPEGDRARFAAFSGALAGAEELQAAIQRFEHLRAAGAFRAARAAARALGDRDGGADRGALRGAEPPVDRARWDAAIAAIDADVRTRFSPQVDALSGGPELLQAAELPRFGRQVSAWVTGGGRTLILCNTHHAWMFLRVVDLTTGRVTRGLRVALDDTMHDHHTYAHAAGVTVVGSSGLFEISLPDGEIVQRFWRSWKDRGKRKHDSELAFREGLPGEGTRLLWGTHGFDDEVLKLVDLDGEQPARTFAGYRQAFPVVGASPPRVVAHRSVWDEGSERTTLQICEPGGGMLARVDVRHAPVAIVAHPSGSGMLTLNTELVQRGNAELHLTEVTERYEVPHAPPFEGDVQDWPPAKPEMVPALDHGLVFVLYTIAGSSESTLVALVPGRPGRPEEWDRVHVPRRTTLCHDERGRRAFALIDHAGGLAVVELDRERPPDLPDGGPFHRCQDAFKGVNGCGIGGRMFDIWNEIHEVPRAERTAAIARMEEERAGDPGRAAELVVALLRFDLVADASRVAARAQAEHPGAPDVKVLPFVLLVHRRAWGEVVEALDREGPDAFEGPRLQHYHHLRALGHARLGDVEKAREHLSIAESMNTVPGTHCTSNLAALRAALAALDQGPDLGPLDPATAPGGIDVRLPTSAQLVAVLRAADASLVAGDAAGAIAVLERPLTFDMAEVHSLSRLAAAYLSLDARTPEDRFRKALALARFMECVELDGGDRAEGLAPGLAWSEERIAELRAQALAWLEADQGTPRAPAWLER